MLRDKMFDLRASLLVAVPVLALLEQAHAAPTKLVAAEITAALAGNTLDGDFEGIAYRQYFDWSGHVIYATPGGMLVNGTWHVSDSDQLCETLPPSTNESCYDIFRTGITIFWVMPESGLRRQAIIMTGKALDFSTVSPN
jgi:hypothetical protein